MNNSVDCFFAYSTRSPELVETVEAAIERINKLGVVRIIGRRSLGLAGKVILSAVQRAINDSDLFICDLTCFDLDVLFELGYAIARDKKVWITLNSTYPQVVKNYQRLSPLAGIGHSTYQNSYEMEQRFLSEEPFLDKTTLYKDVIRSLVQAQSTPVLFYLQSEVRTDASIGLARRLQNLDTDLVIDDPLEVASHPLAWYVQNVDHAYAVIAHLIDQDRESSGTLFQNAKYSLVAGVAHALGKPILMLAHAPFTLTIDYQHLLKIHRTASECINAVETWLPTVEQYHLEQKERYKRYLTEHRIVVELQKINIGEYIAENEARRLSDYFVDTAPYQDALSTTQYKIFVGRKGSGKTANLYQLEQVVNADKRNHVCVIKPVDYEFEGVLRLLAASLPKSETGYLIESLWKYLIYTELALSVYNQIKSDPPHVEHDEAESNLIRYIDSQRDLLQDFAARMEYAIEELCGIDPSLNVRGRRARVSEVLHGGLLARLHDYLGLVLAQKHKVYILVDNLDKAWKNRDDLHILADFLFGLLGAVQAISDQFEGFQRGGPKRQVVNLSLIVFLRSDIFSYIMSTAREGDKVASTRMDWNDPLLLQRVIEERFSASVGSDLPPQDVWGRFFVPTINEVPTKDYIVNRIIPRPRDMIFLCKSALSQAINHRNSRIEEDDIHLAEREYSEYVFYSLLAEAETRFPKMEDVLYEFVGQKEIITRDQIAELLRGTNILEDDKVDYVIELLCETTLLGLETGPDTFEFLYEPSRERVLKKLAEGIASKTEHQRFRINPPFHSFLGIDRVQDIETPLLGSVHTNIKTLLTRMQDALDRKDYAGVLHASSNIFETMAKDIVDLPSVQDQTLASFFARYRKDSRLPEEILDYILATYNARSKTPLAGHGSTEAPAISREAAITLAEMTRAFVNIEYQLK
ncbi:MAG: nucleoside 2-deoxyribosyltransferase [Chloroflexi bacterium]|nr:nucleoside 2-deoxyribosyltransferase [Chloroflexota bacterium]